MTVGDELVVVWTDGAESYLPFRRLRQGCPCAHCAGEPDILGRIWKGKSGPLADSAFQLKKIDTVGGYALQLTWGDGHSTGIYTYDWLRSLGDEGNAGGNAGR